MAADNHPTQGRSGAEWAVSSSRSPGPPSWSQGAARIETDQAGVIVAWNPAAEALYGYSSEEVLGRPVMSVVVPVRAQQQAAAIMEALAGGGCWEGEFDVRHRDGRLMRVVVHDAPLLSAGGEVIGVVGYSLPAADSALGRPRHSQEQRRADGRACSEPGCSIPR